MHPCLLVKLCFEDFSPLNCWKCAVFSTSIGSLCELLSSSCCRHFECDSFKPSFFFFFFFWLNHSATHTVNKHWSYSILHYDLSSCTFKCCAVLDNELPLIPACSLTVIKDLSSPDLMLLSVIVSLWTDDDAEVETLHVVLDKKYLPTEVNHCFFCGVNWHSGFSWTWIFVTDVLKFSDYCLQLLWHLQELCVSGS